MSQINEIEWGRLLASVDGLQRDISKFDAKIDLYLKEAVTRREFDEARDELSEIYERLRLLEAEKNQNSWVPKLMWVLLGSSVTGLVGLIISNIIV